MEETIIERLLDSLDRARFAQLLRGRFRVLEMLAARQPTDDILRELVCVFDEVCPGVFGSVMVLSADQAHLERCAAINLPPAYVRAINGAAIGECAGSCGTAAYLARPIITPDVATDPLWIAWRDTALAAGLRACWSLPIISGKRVLGTFAMYHRHVAEPSPVEMDLITVGCDLARIALEWEDSERARRSCEAQRELLIRRLVTALRTRDDFLSIVSHELRTPLTALHLRLEILMDRLRSTQAGGDVAAQDTAAALQQTRRLERLVAHAIDVRRFDEGKLPVHLERANLTEIVRDAADDMREAFERKRCALEVQADGEVWGQWDRMYIAQVVAILLDNALKYGEGRPVALLVDAVGDRGRFRVRDSGSGIARDRQHAIFERYDRGQSALALGGLGLGLWIARQIVESLNGTITVDSELGRGSTFVVELPCAGGDAS